MEQVGWVVGAFDLPQPLLIRSVRRHDAVLSLITNTKKQTYTQPVEDGNMASHIPRAHRTFASSCSEPSQLEHPIADEDGSFDQSTAFAHPLMCMGLPLPVLLLAGVLL
jgi:hypothetical protein